MIQFQNCRKLERFKILSEKSVEAFFNNWKPFFGAMYAVRSSYQRTVTKVPAWSTVTKIYQIVTTNSLTKKQKKVLDHVTLLHKIPELGLGAVALTDDSPLTKEFEKKLFGVE
jgi:hypothetical protein